MKLQTLLVAIGISLTGMVWADAPSSVAAVTESTSLQKIDANLDHMHTLLARMQQTKDAAERRALLMEYMANARENMMAMRA